MGNRPTAAQRGYNYDWQQYRAWFLGQSENALCALCAALHGRTEPATEVDHIRPHRGDPVLFWDPENHQGLCKACHSRKTAAEAGWGRPPLEMRALRPAAVPCVLVAGPPGSGKTTWVRRRMRRGDLVLDLDAILAALCGRDWYDKPPGVLSFALEAKAAVLERLGAPSGVRRAWLIDAAPRRSQRGVYRERLGARITVLATGPQECLRRIRADARRGSHWQAWQPIVQDWWERYEPDPADTIVET